MKKNLSNLTQLMSQYNRKIEVSSELRYLYDLNFSESTIRTSNFHDPVDNTINSYIEFEKLSEELDSINEKHNYGRIVSVPLNVKRLESWKRKDQKKILNKAISSLAFVPEFKRSVKFFAWVQDNHLIVVFIERCRIKHEWTFKNKFFKSLAFFWKAILIIQNELTRMCRLYIMRENVSNKDSYVIDKMLDKIDSISGEWKLIRSVFTYNVNGFNYGKYVKLLLNHPLLEDNK